MCKRKVLFTNGKTDKKLIMLTNAEKEAIEIICLNYNEWVAKGHTIEFEDVLKINHFSRVLFDSDLESIDEDIEIIGYSEVYELCDYIR